MVFRASGFLEFRVLSFGILVGTRKYLYKRIMAQPSLSSYAPSSLIIAVVSLIYIDVPI
jgi:hypothetical protein